MSDQELETIAPSLKPSMPSSDQVVEAVYEDGVFKPLMPLNLPTGTPIQLRLPRSFVVGATTTSDASSTVATDARRFDAKQVGKRSEDDKESTNPSKFPLLPVIAALIVLGVLAVIFLRPKTQQENAVDDGNAETAAKYAPPEISPASLAEGPRLADPELVSEIRLPALPDGKSAVPRSIAVDSKGYIYIGSVTDGLIRKFDQSGKMLLSWGTQGGANSVFQDLADIVIDKNDTVIALEAEGGKIYFFDTQGKTSRDPVSIPSSYYPRGLTLLSETEVIAVDTGMNRIVRMNLDGTIISQFGAEGPKPGEFNEAIDVVLTPDKREMYVYDASNQRVQRLTLDGNLIRQWKTVEIPGRDGGRLTVDPAGQLYEASPVTKEIIVYNPENKIIAKWAQPESDGPTAVYIDGQNNLYVTYAESGVVRIFRLSPQKTS